MGKAHHLYFVEDKALSKPAVRIKLNEIIIRLPSGTTYETNQAQLTAKKASVKALRQQAEQLLPKRLQLLAEKHDFNYKSVQVKQLKSRWGSCDSHKNIVLNLYLMQLPWECIDYVLLHELVHTNVLRHGPDFWAAMEEVLPNVKLLKRRMSQYHPVLRGSTSQAVA